MKVNNFDIVVLGANLSALISAAFLCKSGYRVLIIETEDTKENDTSEFFDEDATSFIAGCAPNRILYNVFRELSIPIHHQHKFKVNELSYQIAMPTTRIDVGSNWNLYYQEIKREFSDDIEVIDTLYREVTKCDKLLTEIFYSYLLHPQKLSSKLKSSFVMHLESLFKINEDEKNFAEILLSDFNDPLFRRILKLQLNTFSNLLKDDKSNLVTLFLLGTYQRGIVQEVDKLSVLKRIIKDQIVATHGEFIHSKGIDSISVSKRSPLKDKKGIVIKFTDLKRVVEGKTMIYGQALSYLPNALKGMRLSRNVKSLTNRFSPKKAKLTFKYSIDKWGIPIGLKSRVIFSPSASARGEDYDRELLVSVAPETKNGAVSENSFILRGTIKEPFQKGLISAARVEELYNKVTMQLKEIIPFFDDFVKPRKNLKFHDLKADELKNGDFVYDASFLKNLSLGEVHSCEIMKNVFFAGKEYLPQLGFEGEVVSGWRTANVIINKFKLNKMY